MSLNRYVCAAAAGLLVSMSARSADSAGGSDLEQITVYAPHAGGSSLGGTTIGQADIRWLQSAVNNTVYYRGGSYSMLTVKAAYQFLPDAMVELGTTNLSDRNYLVEDGYHAPGRQYFANLRLTF